MKRCCDGTIVGIIINLVRGPRQGVRAEVSAINFKFMFIFSVKVKAQRKCSLYTEVGREVYSFFSFSILVFIS